MNEKLEKLNWELAKGEARLRRAQHEEKILEHQMKQLIPALISLLMAVAALLLLWWGLGTVWSSSSLLSL